MGNVLSLTSISIFPLQAFREFQTMDCKEYLKKYDSFSTKVSGLRINLISLLVIKLLEKV